MVSIDRLSSPHSLIASIALAIKFVKTWRNSLGLVVTSPSVSILEVELDMRRFQPMAK